jgi:atlastin
LFFQFVKTLKMAGDEFSQKYLEKLELDIEEAFVQHQAANESKNIFKTARTPGVYFTIVVIMYVASGIFGLVGLYVFAYFCNLVMGIALLTLAMWAYIK